MFDTIVFPTDGSDPANATLGRVRALADRHDATVAVVFVADTTADSVVRVEGQVVDALEREGEAVVAEAAARLEDDGVTTETAVLQGRPAETIVAFADDRDADLLVLPTHGRGGIRRFLLGSVTERVVRMATTPVLTVGPDARDRRYPFENVLAPTDGSDSASRAVDLGAAVAADYDAHLDVLAVVDVATLGFDVRPATVTKELESRAERVLDDARERVGADVDVDTTLRTGTVRDELLAAVDDCDADLVVMGTHGRSGVDRYLLGSVTESLVRRSPAPVLTVRAVDEERDEG